MEFLKPPPKLSVSEWADQERILTRASSPFPGKWKTSRAEYQRGIMDAFSDPKIQKIVCMMGSQLGKTECMNSILGFFITHDPCPVLVLQPTLEMARAWSQDRLAPMIQTTPALAEQNPKTVQERGKAIDSREQQSSELGKQTDQGCSDGRSGQDASISRDRRKPNPVGNKEDSELLQPKNFSLFDTYSKRGIRYRDTVPGFRPKVLFSEMPEMPTSPDPDLVQDQVAPI
jgi:hypothetical protein